LEEICLFLNLNISLRYIGMNRGRGRGRGRGSATHRIVNNAIRRNERHDRGQLITPSPFPPKFSVFPWNSYTYSTSYFVVTGTTNAITTTEIKARLRAAMGLESDAVITMKIERCRVWNISIGSSTTGTNFAMPNISVRYFELSSSATPSLRQEDRDHGSLNMPAKSGYVWPLTDRVEVLANSENITLCNIDGYTGTECVVLVNLLWRSQDNSAIVTPVSSRADEQEQG